MRFVAVSLVLFGLTLPLVAQADFELQSPTCGYAFPSPMGASGDPEGVSVNAIGAVTASIDATWPCSGVQNFVMDGTDGIGFIPNPVGGVPPTSIVGASEAFIPVPAGTATVSFCWNGWAGDGIANGSWNDGIMIDVIDGSGTQLAVLVYRDDFSDPGTGNFGGPGCSIGGFDEEYSPAGLKTVTGAVVPAGAVYIRVAAWSGLDPIAPASVAADGFTFSGVPPMIFDHTVTCVPTGPSSSDVVFSITNGSPNGVVYLAQTVNNVGTSPNGWFFGIDITLQEIQAQITVGNPWIDVLDASGNFTLAFPLVGVPCPLGIAIDSVPVEFAPFTGILVQAGPSHTWSL